MVYLDSRNCFYPKKYIKLEFNGIDILFNFYLCGIFVDLKSFPVYVKIDFNGVLSTTHKLVSVNINLGIIDPIIFNNAKNIIYISFFTKDYFNISEELFNEYLKKSVSISHFVINDKIPKIITN